MHFKPLITGAVGLIGASVASFFGGWDAGLRVLLIVMGLDTSFGLLLAFLKRSKKTESGGLSSKSAWFGITRKFGTLAVVAVAAQLDGLMGTSFLRDAAVLSYIAGELISLTENTALLGVPWPPVVLRAIDVLKNQADGGEKK